MIDVLLLLTKIIFPYIVTNACEDNVSVHKFNESANQFINQSVGLRDRQLRRARRVPGIGFTLAVVGSVAGVFAPLKNCCGTI